MLKKDKNKDEDYEKRKRKNGEKCDAIKLEK